VTNELHALAREVAWPVPDALAAAASQLEQSQWPEVVGRWSRLTPTGFPIELTVASSDTACRWTTEVAGPECADTRRLGLVAAQMAAAGQPVAPALLTRLEDLQARGTLRYGAWLGGRSAGNVHVDDARATSGASRFKLYAEVPRESSFDAAALLPASLCALLAHVPRTARASMIGIEPARERVEVYFRLPALDAEDLRPVFRAAGCDRALQALERCLPDGTRRLAGRRLGLSVAVDGDSRTEAAVVVSARTLFPACPDMLAELVPALGCVPMQVARPTLVTMRVPAGGENVGFVVGLTYRRRADSADRRSPN
jgi:hypothetical protein